MNIKTKLKSIEFKTLFFILIFNIGIILLFWLSELVFFNVFYRYYQTNAIEKVVENINRSDEDVYVLAEKLAYDSEMCISVINKSYIAYNFNTMKNGCELNRNNEEVDRAIDDFMQNKYQLKKYYINNHENKNKGILYGINKEGKNIFIYNATNNDSRFYLFFNKQLGYFILIIFVISLLSSVYIAKYVTKPIKLITKKAKKIGEGNYDTKFPKNGILEIDELSETLEAVQKDLSKMDETKRDLMANVSHDLKTPLTMIKAYAEMIKDISYKKKDKMDEHLDIIMEETDRLTILVNDILELSKAQHNVLEFNFTEFDLVNEIKNIIKRFTVMKEMENYEFKIEVPKKAIVKADKDKINQVIYNLVGNAVNYTGEDKLVKIKVSKVSKAYLVEVIDTGKGIKEDELPFIWDKYYKNEKNHQRNIVSTGLGLSIVKEILVKHNFKYGIKTKKGEGSTFYFKINI